MRRLVRHRWWALLGLGLLLAILLPGLPHALDVDNSLSIWFLEDDPNVQAYRTFQETFGNDEVILVRVQEPDGVFRAEALERMKRASEEFESIEGVARTYSLLDARRIREVESLLGAARSALGSGDRVERIVPSELPDDPEAYEAIREAAMDHPLVGERFVGGDGEQAMLVVQMERLEDFDSRRGDIVDAVRASANEVYGDDFAMGGNGVIYTAMNKLTNRDFGTFVSLGYLLMFLLLWWIFREWRLVVAALGVVFGATLFALGAMGTMGTRLNMVTVVLPTLIVVLGVADVVHFPVAYREARREAAPDAEQLEIVGRALTEVVGPCTMTSLTTAAGFLSLTSSRMAGVGQVGIYAAVGILAALALSVVTMSIVFMSGEADAEEARYASPRIDWFLSTARGLLERRPVAVAVASAAVVGALTWSATTLEVDTYTLGYFPDDHRVVREHESIENDWGPYMPLEFTVAPADDRSYRTQEFLSKSEEFAKRASEHPRIGDAFHVGQLYQYIVARTSPGHEYGDPLNDKKIEVATSLLEEDDGEDVAPLADQFVANDGKLGRITLTAEMMSASDLRTTLDELRTIADDVYGSSARVEPAGWLPLYASILAYIVDSQVRSFGIAVALVFLLMLVWTRSLRLSLVSLIPNFLPVLVMLGAMAAADIRLNVTTASIGAIVIGVAIDDTIHFLDAWRRAERDGRDWSSCLEFAYRRAGPALCTTTIVLAGGFPVLMLASIDTVVYFGFLVTVAAVAALLSDLLVLPLLFRLWPAND